ncbi:YeeE/YedE thiosulfate transporter family protein [Desulfuribacillus alkaliarsenatis]|nr:YeeE/YedE thiosulfate transporter family protein [Desulfuribacillus alkaliarsenatis]
MKHLLKLEWPYLWGGIAIAVFNTFFLLLNGKPWGVTTSLTLLSAKIVDFFGLGISGWSYYMGNERYAQFINNWIIEIDLIIIIGFFAGVLISSISAKEFSWKKIRSKKQIMLAITGGFIMGYGARLASGCNVGAFIGSFSSLSLHGWVFAIASFVGVYMGIKIMYSR